MPSFRTDFHATLDEIIELVDAWMQTYPIIVTAFAMPQQFGIVRENLRETLVRPRVDQIVFTEIPVDPSCQQAYDVGVSGISVLYLDVGRLGETGLPQSSLSTMHTNPLWSKLNRELKKLTTPGATLIYENGLRPFARNARFTAGAKALAASGIPLRQFAQATNFHYVPK